MYAIIETGGKQYKVAVGDKVQKGDIIGQMDEGKLGANVYASFDGEVVAVTDRVVIRRESK